MSNGFGFSFPHDPDDDDRNRDRDNNQSGHDPFGIFGFPGGFGRAGSGASGGGGNGGLGDLLNQFGSMLSGMGASLNNPENRAAVNFEVAERIARQQIGQSVPVRANDATAVEESVRLAELWLNEACGLPASNAKVVSWNAENWVHETMPMWKRLVTPVAEHMNRAQLESMPAEAQEMMGPMISMMNQMNAMNQGMQVGRALGDLGQQTLSGGDFGLPVAPKNTIAVLPANSSGAAEELGIPAQEVLVYVAAREAARQRLFTHVPWLAERLVSSVEEYAVGLVIDTSHLEEATRELNLESGDPQAIQEALGKLQGMDLSPKISSTNSTAVSRLETLLALIDGWAEQVVEDALADRIPSTRALTEAWRRRRATGGSAEKAFAEVAGIEFAAPKVSDAAELWRRATVAVGVERRDQVWEHPDFLPTAQSLENPAEFIDRLLDDSEDTTFDEEFAKLEEMLRKDSEEPGDADDSGYGEGSSDPS